MKITLPTSVLALTLLTAGMAIPAIATNQADYNTSVRNDGSPMITGSGVRATADRSVKPFTMITATDASNLVIVVGDTFSVKVSADDNVLAQITTTTRGQTLHIDSTGSYSVKHPPVVTITLPDLKGVTLEGSGDARVDGLKGSAVSLKGLGSGDFSVSGRVDKVSVRIDGSGDADLSGLDAQDVDAAIYGTGSALVRASRSLEAAVFGTGDIRYTGTDNVRQQVAGTGKIVRLPR